MTDNEETPFEPASFEPTPFDAAAASADAPKDGGANYETILKIPVTVQVVLGTTTMPVASLMKLGRGAVIALDQKVGEPVNIVVNGRIVARGEVVVVDEATSRFGVSLTEIVASSGAEKAA
jgi:flagellar motor switch protein FliN